MELWDFWDDKEGDYVSPVSIPLMEYSSGAILCYKGIILSDFCTANKNHELIFIDVRP